MRRTASHAARAAAIAVTTKPAASQKTSSVTERKTAWTALTNLTAVGIVPSVLCDFDFTIKIDLTKLVLSSGYPTKVVKCESPSVLCRDGSLCIPHTELCDGKRDCPDGYDETFCFDRCPNTGTRFTSSIVQKMSIKYVKSQFFFSYR